MSVWKLLSVVVGVGLLLAVFRGRVQASDEPTGFVDRMYTDADGKSVKYVLFVPKNYKKDSPVPVILFLHGYGECGTDGKKHTQVGIGKAIRQREQDFPFLVVFPQTQVPGKGFTQIARNWHPSQPEGKRAVAILDEVMKQYSVDPKRVYLTGLSMGGFGTWGMAAALPHRWAAIVPICGGGDPKEADKIKHIPCWCFHGDQDKVVLPEQSRRMIEALRKVGAEPRYEELKGVGHNSWDYAYNKDELYEWLLQQRLK